MSFRAARRSVRDSPSAMSAVEEVSEREESGGGGG